MYQRKAPFQAVNFFTSAKTKVPIQNRGGMVRDALIQASLDPDVRALDFVEETAMGTASVALNAIVIEKDEGRFYLDIAPGRPLRGLEEQDMVDAALARLGLMAVVLTAADILREPGFSNAREVWASGQRAVPVPMRMRILRELADDGPMTLDRLCRSIEGSQDPVPAVLALACADVVEIEIKQEPLGPATRVRLRS
jgi:hypothetical protein